MKTSQPASDRRRWTRDELLLAIHLYYRIPFGRQHMRAPEIIELAECLKRTPGSVSMKLNNLTSLDPSEAERGIKGLSGASTLDREVWTEFHQSPENMAAEAENLWTTVVERHNFTPVPTDVGKPRQIPAEITAPEKPHSGPTSTERLTTVRLAQGFFRRAVLAAYRSRCCISGNPVPTLLIASHILPWGQYPEHRIDPRNGLCLSRLHDAAFDQHLITLDEKYRLVLSKSLRDFAAAEAIRTNFVAFEGRKIQMPEKFFPNPDYLAKHREGFCEG